MLRLTSLSILICLATVLLFVPRARTTGSLVQVTRTSEQSLNVNPILSDDGGALVFESNADFNGSGNANNFHTIKTQPSAADPIFDEIVESRSSAPSISADARITALASTEDLIGQNVDRNSEIYIVDGTTIKQLTHTTPLNETTRLSDGNFEPSISNDGRLIVFSSNRFESKTVRELFLLDTQTLVITPLTTRTDNLQSINPKMSGDGSHVYFIQQTSNGETNLVATNIADHSNQLLAENVAGLAFSPGRAVSNDGTRLVYSMQTNINQTQAFMYDARRNEQRQLTQLGTRSSDVALNASISGDGTRVTFSTRRRVISPSDGSVELYVIDIPTGAVEQLTNAPSSATGEVVSSLNHDGSRVAFSFPRVLTTTVTDQASANNSEIFYTSPTDRPQFGTAKVSNAATRNFEDARVAPDSIAVMTANSLSTKTFQTDFHKELPFELERVTVRVNGISARLLYVSLSDVVFVVPSTLADGPAEIVVTNSEGFPLKAQAIVSRSAPGVFNNSGQAIVLDAATLTTGPFDPTTGELRLLIFATGVRHASQLSVILGGEVLPVESVVNSELPGLDEVHVRVPPQMRGAGPTSVLLKADGIEANLLTTSLSGSALRDIMINELLADPPDGIAGDANRDGVRDSSQDEFVELVNTTKRDLDLTGYVLQTRPSSASNDTIRHRFAAGTILSAGTAIVVFGGGTINSTDAEFGGSQVLRASSGGLSLGNSGSVVTLRDAAGSTVTSVTYGSAIGIAADINQSITRSPDMSGSFVPHQSVDDRLFSAGTKINRERFLPNPTVAMVMVNPTVATLQTGQTFQLSANAFDLEGHQLFDVIFSWRSSDELILRVDANGLATAIHGGASEVQATGRGVQSLPTIITVATPTPTPTPIASPTPAPTPTIQPTPTPTPSPNALPAIVISEFRTRGPNGASDEFVEIYNNSDLSVDVSGWKLKASSNTGTISNRLVFAARTIMPSHKHLLLANGSSYTGSVVPDQTFATGLANDGGLALTLQNDVVVDQIGLSAGSAFREGMHLAPLPSDANQSYERKRGGIFGSTQDTADNFSDFGLLTPSDPQNLSSEPTPGPSPVPTPSPSPLPTPSPSPTVNPTPTPLPSPSPSPSPVPSPSPTPLPSPSPSATPTPSPSPTATPTPTPQLPPLVISEFRTRGPNGASDEFVEIYNNSESPSNVGGIKIRGSSSGGTVTTKLTINANTVIPAHGHFLAINSSGYSESTTGDQSFTSGFGNDGGIAVTTPDDIVIDQVGMSAGSAFKEGSFLPPLAVDANQSYERKPGGLVGSSQDTNDNLTDFQLITPSDPQNIQSNPTPGSTPTPTPTPAPSPTVSPSPSPQPTPSPSPSPSSTPMPPDSHVVISQIYGGGGNSGAPFRNDFIELFNTGNTSVDLTGWSVQYASSTAATWSVTSLTSIQLAPGQHYLVQEASGGTTGALLPAPDASGTIALAASAGKVALVKNTVTLSGTCPNALGIVDLVGYGSAANCFEGNGAAPVPGNTTAVTRGNGGCLDSGNNNTDFAIAAPSPKNTVSTIQTCGAGSALHFNANLQTVSEIALIILLYNGASWHFR